MESFRIQMVVFLVILSASLKIHALAKEEFEIDGDNIIAENLKDEIPVQMKQTQKSSSFTKFKYNMEDDSQRHNGIPSLLISVTGLQNVPSDLPTKKRTLDDRLDSESKHRVSSSHLPHSGPYSQNIPAKNLLPQEVQYDTHASEFRSSHQCAPRTQEVECDTKHSQHFVPCKEGWFHFGEKCYKYFPQPRTWSEASQNCTLEGGHLATVSSNDIQQFLNAFIMLRERSIVYIGASDIQTESIFNWEDGTPFIYSNWLHDQPDDFREREDCVEMRFVFIRRTDPRSNPCQVGFWNDIPCEVRQPYICQMDNYNGLERLSPDPRFCSYNEGGGFKYRDSCFHIVRSKRTWEEAQRHCEENFNGNLVTILDTEEEMFLNYLLPDCDEDFWIGITRQDKAVQNWTSGWPVAHNRLSVDLQQFPSGTCVRRSRDMYWSPADCLCEFPFVCETTKSPAPVLKKAPEGWTCPRRSTQWLDLGGEFCYIFGTNLNLNWDQANNECRRNGGTLASINSRDEQLILQNFLLKYNRINIGLRRSSGNRNVFHWVDGRSVDYTNWASGQPDNERDECVEMRSYLEYSYTWDDIPCNTVRRSAYICSARKVPPNTK